MPFQRYLLGPIDCILQSCVGMPLIKNAQLHKNIDGIDEDFEDKHKKWLGILI